MTSESTPTQLATAGRGGTLTTPAPAVGPEDGGVARSSGMTPAAAANFLRLQADAIEAGGVPVAVTLQVRPLDAGSEPRSAAERMAGTRARRRLSATERNGFVAATQPTPGIPPGPPQQEDPEDLGKEAGLSRETTDQRAGVPVGARASGPDVAVADPGGATQQRRVRTPGRKGFPPADFAPKDSHRSLAAARNVDLALEVAKFKDHEFQRKITDWDRTFANWLRNARSSAGSAITGGRFALRPTDIRQKTTPGSFDYSKVLAKPNGAG